MHVKSSKSLTSFSMDCRYKTLKRALNLRGIVGICSCKRTLPDNKITSHAFERLLNDSPGHD